MTVDTDLLLAELTLIGPVSRAALVEAVSEPPRLARTVDGATTLTVTVQDRDRGLLRSGMFDARSYAVCDEVNFELVGVGKSGHRLTLTFEDAVVSALRRKVEPFAWAASTLSRADMVRRLATECNLDVWVDPADRGPVNRAVTRGPQQEGQGGVGADDSWSLLGSLASDAGWRRFSDGRRLVVGSDDWLAGLLPPVPIAEHSGPVHDIDLDLDVGRPANRATLDVDAGRWALRPGQWVVPSGMGPGDGAWLVESFERPLTRHRARVGLVRRQLVLAEAAPEVTEDAEADFLPEGDVQVTAARSTAGSFPPVAGLGNVRPHVAAAAAELKARFPAIASIGGYRAGAIDPNGHPAGRALDVMVHRNRALGDQILRFCEQNWDRLRIEYVIWYQRIYKSPTSGGRLMADRGSITANHQDHPHINFRP